MKNILAFAGSNSSTSINHQLVEYVVNQLSGYTTKTVKLVDYETPMYSEDEERTQGFSDGIVGLREEISKSDALIISVNEHNGSWSAFFKNIIDWLSRLDRNFLAGKKVLILSTSPGKRGGIGALEFAESVFPRFGSESILSFSFPSFHSNFSLEKKEITDQPLVLALQEVLSTFAEQIK